MNLLFLEKQPLQNVQQQSEPLMPKALHPTEKQTSNQYTNSVGLAADRNYFISNRCVKLLDRKKKSRNAVGVSIELIDIV